MDNVIRRCVIKVDNYRDKASEMEFVATHFSRMCNGEGLETSPRPDFVAMLSYFLLHSILQEIISDFGPLYIVDNTFYVVW